MMIFNRATLLLSLLFGMSIQRGFVDAATPPRSITTLADFEKSDFSKMYECKKEGGRVFQFPNGEKNYIYDSNLRSPDGSDETEIQIVAKGERIESLEITFEGFEKKYEVIECLLRSVSRAGDLRLAIEFIKDNIEGPVPRLPDDTSFQYGSFNISAGEIAFHQQLLIERIKKNRHTFTCPRRGPFVDR